MAPTLHLVRHAEGFHNANRDRSVRDPKLTPFGEEQCAQLCREFAHHDKLTHLVASHLRRTVQTCHRCFRPAVEAGKRVILLPELQETSDDPSAIGTDAADLEREYGAGLVDASRVGPGWNDKRPHTRWAMGEAKIEARARAARVLLRELARGPGADDAHLAVVSHGTFLLFLTEDRAALGGYGRPWKNAEVRSYRSLDLWGADGETLLRRVHVDHFATPASAPLPEDRTSERGPTRIDDGTGTGGDGTREG
ncbi:hypothetical protein DL763_002136 [Monosporascus cannonballus]|nr:hypothetical protein DL763_002136 [Monosporascus cannonballus]